MSSDRALGMPATRSPPRESLLKHRILAQRSLELGLGREPGDRDSGTAGAHGQS